MVYSALWRTLALEASGTLSAHRQAMRNHLQSEANPTCDLPRDYLMRWLHTEYILKGVYLGLLVFVALQETSWWDAGRVALCTAAGLVLFLAVSGVRKVREGYQIKGRVPAFILFLLLESPGLVYTGIILGTFVGAMWVRNPSADASYLPATVLGGAALGSVFGLLQQVRDRWARLGLSLALGVGLVAGALYLFGQLHQLDEPAPSKLSLFGIQLLLGIPWFYVLTFAGKEEESEIEVGAICAALGLGVNLLPWNNPSYRSLSLLIPMMLYVFYTIRVLPGLRVFKHVVRGLSYANIGRYRLALMAFRRALQLDPKNRLARESLWRLHRQMDLRQAVRDPETLALIDFDLCLNRAGELLLKPGPTPAMLAEAHRLLEFVASQRPAMEPAADYWRAVAYTHAQQFDQAAAALERVLDSQRPEAGNPHRWAMLLPAWQLALTLHPELTRRVGNVQLPLPGRRMELITAVERHLAKHSEDKAIWDIKRVVYSGLTEAEYQAAAHGDEPLPHFDYGYAQQLGLALINDASQWQRGAEYLRMAAHGMPVMGPAIFTQIAQAHERAGNAEGAWHNYELGIRAGRAIGPKNLSDADRQAFFGTVRRMGEAAAAQNNVPAALEYYHLYTEYERSGVETLRILAELYERHGDPLSALRVTEQALLYDSSNKELLERKDKYYYSVMPADLRARLDSVGKAFDVEYCLRKARSLVNIRDASLDLIDWAQHLVELVLVVQPGNLQAKVLRARILLMKGERDEAVATLEAVRSPKPEKFASGEDEEAWFLSSQLLGKLYLDELGKPEEAVQCLQDFRKSPRSGADTMYRLGRAYEMLGDTARAVKYYEQVTAYDGHPLAPDARDALYRLQTHSQS
jgi:tetratricopeptide (TPR) repeat protein